MVCVVAAGHSILLGIAMLEISLDVRAMYVQLCIGQRPAKTYKSETVRLNFTLFGRRSTKPTVNLRGLRARQGMSLRKSTRAVKVVPID